MASYERIKKPNFQPAKLPQGSSFPQPSYAPAPQPQKVGQTLEEMEISRANAERLGDHLVNLSEAAPDQGIQAKPEAYTESGNFSYQGVYAPQNERREELIADNLASMVQRRATAALQRQQEDTVNDPFAPRTISESAEEVSETVEQFELQRIKEFNNQEIANDPETMASMQQRIHAADQATGMKSAIIYLMVQNEEGAEQGIDIVVIPGDPQYPPIHRFKPIDWRDLQKRLINFRATATNSSRRTAFEGPAQLLYTAMIKPIEKTLSNIGVNHLHLVLDQELQTMPVSALSNEHEFLIERFSLSVSPSFSMTQTTPLNQESPEITALGETTFNGPAPLPFVLPEVMHINNLEGITIPKEYLFNLANLQKYLQEQEVEPNIQAQLGSLLPRLNRIQDILGQAVQQHPQGGEKVQEALKLGLGEEVASQILHIATHGEAKGGDHINLSTRQGEINIQELIELDFSAIEMVVFSACESLVDNNSGSSSNLAKDREFGLGGAMWSQGTESAIGSLWRVSDEGTMAMMRTFYRILSEQRGLTRAQILQEAQLAMIEQRVKIKSNSLIYRPKASAEEPNPKLIAQLLPNNLSIQDQNFEHPYYWSAFELLGSAY
ncbi:MAG: CHAT domain-containing protein [Spirulinaceae cyanobacterium]